MPMFETCSRETEFADDALRRGSFFCCGVGDLGRERVAIVSLSWPTGKEVSATGGVPCVDTTVGGGERICAPATEGPPPWSVETPRSSVEIPWRTSSSSSVRIAVRLVRSRNSPARADMLQRRLRATVRDCTVGRTCQQAFAALGADPARITSATHICHRHAFRSGPETGAKNERQTSRHEAGELCDASETTELLLLLNSGRVERLDRQEGRARSSCHWQDRASTCGLDCCGETNYICDFSANKCHQTSYDVEMLKACVRR